MKEKVTPVKCIYAVFLAAEAAIFLAFNVMAAVTPADPVYLKYSGVLLCLAISAIMIYFYGADGAIVTCAIAFTAVSDFFILVKDSHYEIGVTTFFVAQCVYFFRLYFKRMNARVRFGKFNVRALYISLVLRTALIFATLLSLALTVGLNYLLCACTFYFITLLCNCADALFTVRGGLKNILFAIGLLLFVCCDVCVGLHNFGSVLGVNLPAWLISFVRYAIWIFYLPSQALIVCSLGHGIVGADGRRKKAESADDVSKEGVRKEEIGK